MSNDAGGFAGHVPRPTDDVSAHVHAALNRLAGDLPRLGIALSGGGDSTALMHLVHGWAGGRVLMAATVDHGLRPEAADEARVAQDAAASLGIAHTTLRWQRGAPGGNLMAAARDARLRLLAGWARENRLDAVLLGHTLDDQAETVLMRLARGSGVDGLSGMAERRSAGEVCWLRPLLGQSRAALRAWLRERGVGWIDDPSNENRDYDRVRIRQALAGLGLPAGRIAQTAGNMGMAREALQVFAAQVAEGADAGRGSLKLPLASFRRAPPEIRRRLLVAGLRLVSGADYPPRRAPVLHALAALAAGSRLTLDGVIAEPRSDWLHLCREPAAAARAPAVTQDGMVWDGRWMVRGLAPGHEVRALGYDPLPGLGWRASGLARDEAAASPGLWRGELLVAAPLVQPAAGVQVTALRGLPEFRALLYTH